jgi:hypothetical protein
MLHCKRFIDIDSIPGLHWSAASNGAFYSTLTFLKCLKDAGVENAEYRYLIFYDDDAPVGSAVISRFYLNLDLLAGLSFITKIKKRHPKLLRMPVICCGLPASFGQHNFYVSEAKYKTDAAMLTHRQMLSYAEATNTNLMAWKEFNPEMGVYDTLKGSGYINLPTLPDNIITLPGSGVESFLSGLRSSYRRKYKMAATLMSQQGHASQQRETVKGVRSSANVSAAFVHGSPAAENEPALKFSIEPYSKEHAEAFYNAYISLMGRTPVKLEEYPISFFQLLPEALKGKLFMLKLSNKAMNETLSALVVCDPACFYFILIAKKHEKYQEALYTELIRCIVLFGASKGYKEIRLGQTSYYAKMSCGSRPLRLEAFLLFRKSWKNKLFAIFGKLLFPETRLPVMHSYKSGI